MPKYYTGVGSRKAPEDILRLMTDIARMLAYKGYVLRSGGADGSDRAFEEGAKKRSIYWANDATPKAMAIAEMYHPAWDRMGDYAKKLHGRNAFQVLGRTLNVPSSFLICWTPDGCKTHEERSTRTGGTGTAISIADKHGVPVFNLAVPEDRQRLELAVDSWKTSMQEAASDWIPNH